MKEKATFWRAPDIGELELLKATYISHTFSRHTHAGYVIGMIERGVEVFYYRGAIHRALPGDVVIINPDEVHTGHSGDRSGWTYRMFYPSIDMLRQVAGSITNGSGEMPYFKDAVIKDRQLARQIKGLHHLLETSQSFLERQSFFFDIMGRLIIQCAGNPPAIRRSGPERTAIKSAMDYIDENITDNISLGQLSTHAGLSPFYFSRLFRQYTGLPPHAYHKQQRIRLAKRLLMKKMPIAQVAAEAGFADQSHLTRHFKQIVGVTPGQYAAQSR